MCNSKTLFYIFNIFIHLVPPSLVLNVGVAVIMGLHTHACGTFWGCIFQLCCENMLGYGAPEITAVVPGISSARDTGIFLGLSDSFKYKIYSFKKINL